MPSVFDALCQSPARLGGKLDLGAGQSLALWSNSHAEVRYENARHHTLSLYTEGGTECRRVDRNLTGHPGAICLMPCDSPSQWQIGAPFRFVHLYFPDRALRLFLAEVLDRAPADFTLPELTYGEDPVLMSEMARLATLTAGHDTLAAQEVVVRIYHHLLSRALALPQAPVKGGLGRAASRRVIAHIAATLDQTHSLETLAGVAGLSAFHFQRMFRQSHGISPHDYIDRQRILHAKTLIAARQPLAQVAGACGYSSQSHLTRAFHRATGLTPGRFAAVCHG